jgi:hypothetical protein
MCSVLNTDCIVSGHFFFGIFRRHNNTVPIAFGMEVDK